MRTSLSPLTGSVVKPDAVGFFASYLDYVRASACMIKLISQKQRVSSLTFFEIYSVTFLRNSACFIFFWSNSRYFSLASRSTSILCSCMYLSWPSFFFLRSFS